MLWREEQRRQRAGEIEEEMTKDLERRAALLLSADRIRSFIENTRVVAGAPEANAAYWPTWVAWARQRVDALERRALSRELPSDAVWFLTAREQSRAPSTTDG